MKIGSLFSGIGGLELGLEQAGIGHTVWQVECEARCIKILERHWPDTQRYLDVRHVGKKNLEKVDLLCGGFPCQDLSSANVSRIGLAGTKSGLWVEYLRIVRELTPSWVVVENVASGAHSWVDTVCSDLAKLRYACLPIPLSAADVGAPHIRARVFIVACHSDANCQSMESKHEEARRLPTTANDFPWSEYEGLQLVDGVSRGMDLLGNSVVPRCSEVIGNVIRELAKPVI